MAYSDHFKLTDDLIQHLDPILAGLNDPFIESRYTGFLAVSSVTVLELAMKTIFCDFALAKHKVLGNFCAKYFDRINGRIGLRPIRDDYLPRFGARYELRFQRALEKLEQQHLVAAGASIKASYGNLITWRNEFAHEGNVPVTASYAEVKRAFDCGKVVMTCLASCMRR
ncbi:MAG: HEPN domain-containing protein [Lacunisphaera sp.]|nr:HEPN domain-containing protein [Lacunisphaera sp.]